MKSYAEQKGRFRIILILLSLIFLLPIYSNKAEAAAPQPVGQVLHILGQPMVERNASHIPLKIGSLIYQGDIILTAALTRATIKFNDQSLMNIGSNTRMQINQYVYNEKDKVRNVKFNLLGGQLRMFARKLAGFKKTDIKLDTPTATIGVRGTEFIVSAVKTKKVGKKVPQAQISSTTFWAFNGNSQVANDAGLGSWVAQGSSGDDTQWLVYVYCADGTIYVQNLFGGPVYMIRPGQTGWVEANMVSVQDIPADQIQSMFLMTNVPGSSYGDGEAIDVVAPTAPPTVGPGQTPVVPIQNLQLGPPLGVTPPPPPSQVLSTISTTVPATTSETSTTTSTLSTITTSNSSTTSTKPTTVSTTSRPSTSVSSTISPGPITSTVPSP